MLRNRTCLSRLFHIIVTPMTPYTQLNDFRMSKKSVGPNCLESTDNGVAQSDFGSLGVAVTDIQDSVVRFPII